MALRGEFLRVDESGKVVVSPIGSEQWMPPEIKEVLQIEDLPVIFWEETSPEDIVEDCRRSFYVGLTLMRAPQSKVLLACLTTKREIYVINLVNPKHLEFFEGLSECDLRFYCLKGERIHFRLREHCSVQFEYLINMTALDVFLSMRKKAIELRAVQKPYTLRNLSESSLAYHDKYDMIKYWLGVSVDRKSKQEEVLETRQIWQEPFSPTVRNVIRFRCWFTRALGVRLSEAYRKQCLSCGDRLYEFALLDDDSYRFFKSQIENGSFTYSNVLGALNQCAIDKSS